MALTRRHAILASLVLPGCAIQPLAPFATSPIPAPARPAVFRPPAAGQRWTYRKMNFFNSSVLDVVQESVAVAAASTVEVSRRSQSGADLPSETHAAWGQLLRDPAWDYPMNFEAPMPLWPASLDVGATGVVNGYYRMDGGSIRFWIQVSCVVRGWERIAVSAGAFDTLRVERLIQLDHQDFSRAYTTRRDIMWLSPEVGRWVARDTSGEYRTGSGAMRPSDAREDHFQWELTAWQ